MISIVRPAALRKVRVVSVARLRELADLPESSEKGSSIAREDWLTNWRPEEKLPVAPGMVTPSGEGSRTLAPARLTVYEGRPAESRVMVAEIWAVGD